MKIKDIQIVGEKLGVTGVIRGRVKDAVYVEVNNLDMTIDTDNDGSWGITEDEIVAFIKERRKLSD